MQNTSNTTTDVEMLVKPFGGAYALKVNINLGKDGTSCYSKQLNYPLVVTEKSIIRFTATVSGGSTTDVSIGYDIVLK